MWNQWQSFGKMAEGWDFELLVVQNDLKLDRASETYIKHIGKLAPMSMWNKNIDLFMGPK